jgi:23S rRNA (cytidine2498-2'-O)-methyltransferase
MKILATAQENSLAYAIHEIQENLNVSQICKLTKGVFTFETQESLENFKPIFVRYLMPISIEKEINVEDDLDIQELFKDIKCSNNDVFILHFSILDSHSELNKANIIAKCLKYFKESGIIINPKTANKIICLTIFNNKLYFGISTITESLNSWPLGECRFKYETNQICRAEFKLLEAIEYFKIKLLNYKNALDLGAAPGGWTRILLEKGLHVTAVDPAELNESLSINNNLFHYRGTSQNFFREYNSEKYDIIVNDMKMDTKKSIKIMEEAAKHLKNNGIIIITLKLNPNRELEEVKECIKLIKNNYEIIGIHQLFHNRSEATIVFKNIYSNL